MRREVTFQEKYCETEIGDVGHVLRDSSGFSAILVLEGKFDGKRTRG